jgi:hypothetical protein
MRDIDEILSYEEYIDCCEKAADLAQLIHGDYQYVTNEELDNYYKLLFKINEYKRKQERNLMNKDYEKDKTTNTESEG